MYWRPPTDAELAPWKGARTIDDFPEPVVDVWHENYDQVRWFASMLTQFNYGAFGATGFPYMLAHREFDDMGLTGTERDEWKWKLKVMESAALSIINRPTPK